MVIFIIVLIGVLQCVVFYANYRKLQHYKDIFSNIGYLNINMSDDGFVQGINANPTNPIFNVILTSINRYLVNNKGQVSDYYLMKDIVDRNVDAKEDEINTLIPIPLYLGLIGTMSCIFVGLTLLHLESLFGPEAEAIKGIDPLLKGVAVAMITSIIGIFLTTLGSYIAKNSKTKVEENKNEFLSWMQEKLLPQLSNDTASALQTMTTNLTNFNVTFAENTQTLNVTFEQVNDLYKNQAELYRFIAELRIEDIATANIQVYQKLINCTNEIGKLGSYLQGVGNYSRELQQVVTEIQKYFNQELEQLTRRETLFAETINKIDFNTKEALDDFNRHFSASLQKTQETFEHIISEIDDTLRTQQEKLKTALDNQNALIIQSIDYQQKALEMKLQDATKLVDELNKIGDKIASITRLEQTMKDQNRKFDALLSEIAKLSQIKATGGEIKIASQPNKTVKTALLTTVSILSLAVLSYFIPQFIKWISELLKWLF
jgi:hypothetical protein